MEREEHWRLRLIELTKDLDLKHVTMAGHMGVEPSYFSRLLYPPGKPGRKNLGLETLIALRKAFDLPADWFDLPLGTSLPSRRSGNSRGGAHFAQTPSDPEDVLPITQVVWPFKHVSYRRLMELRIALGKRGAAEAINDIDQILDVVVTKWERAASKKKKSG